MEDLIIAMADLETVASAAKSQAEKHFKNYILVRTYIKAYDGDELVKFTWKQTVKNL